MAYKLSFSEDKSSVNLDKELLAYVVPLSGNPQHYAIISPFSERELLRHAHTQHVVFEGYTPVLPQIREQVIAYLERKINRGTQRTDQNRKLRRYAGIAGIAFCTMFVFTGFIDDLIFDPLFLFIIGNTFYGAWKEKRQVLQLKSGVAAIDFRENALLNAISTVFQQLDDAEFDFPDWEEIAAHIPPEQLRNTLSIMKELIDFHSINSLKNEVTKLELLIEQGFPPFTLVHQIKKWRLQRRIDAQQQRIMQKWELQPSYREVYSMVISVLDRLV